MQCQIWVTFHSLRLGLAGLTLLAGDPSSFEGITITKQSKQKRLVTKYRWLTLVPVGNLTQPNRMLVK